MKPTDLLSAGSGPRRLAARVALVGLAGCVAGAILQTGALLEAYLVAVAFAFTIVLGMMFFVLLHHVTDAGWSTVPRRWAEHFLGALPVLAVLFVPVVAGLDRVYGWAGHDAGGEHGHLLHHKEPWLNAGFFVIRSVVYVLVWIGLARWLRARSFAQDESGDARLSLRLRRGSAPALIAYALTVTFASFDWLMSVDYAWFSTIFGVYVWSHGVLGAIALLAMVAVGFREGPRRGLVPSDRLHDLGKLMFAFAVWWGYIAFSQWFLIWYANIPEETGWMLARWHGGWKFLTSVLVAALFVVPFVVLMPAAAKRRAGVLRATGSLVLLGCWLGMAWIVMPVRNPDGPGAWTVLWSLSSLLFVCGAAGWAVVRSMELHPLVPRRDPRLSEALADDHGHVTAEEAHA